MTAITAASHVLLEKSLEANFIPHLPPLLKDDQPADQKKRRTCRERSPHLRYPLTQA